MTREERLTSLLEAFDRCAEQYASESNALRLETDSVYKNNRTEDPAKLKLHVAHLHYHAYVLEFRYTARATLNTVQSILECLVYPEKTPDAIALPLPLLLDYCNVDTLSPPCIPMIADGESMEEAFSALTDTLRTHRDLIANTCASEEQRTAVLQAFLKEIIAILHLTPDPTAEAYGVRPYLGPALYDFLTLRFVSVHFLNFIKGDRATAIKQLSKIKEPFSYETRLLRLLEKETAIPCDLPLAREILSDAFTKGGSQRTSGKEFFCMMLAWFLLTALLFPVYAGIYYLMRFFAVGSDSVFLLTSGANVAYSFLFAFLTAIAASYFLRLPLLSRLYRKNYARRLALDHLQNGKGADRLIKVLLHLIVIASLVLTVFISKWNVNFSEGSFVDNSAFFSLQGEYHAYSDIECCYYKPDRVNDLGETIPYPSYALRLKDGREIDFYELAEIEEYDPALLDFLRSKGVVIDTSKK